jgi:hypothetical protein
MTTTRDRQPKATWIRVEWMDGRKPEYHRNVAAFARANGMTYSRATRQKGFTIQHTEWLVRGKWIPCSPDYDHEAPAWYMSKTGLADMPWPLEEGCVAYCPIIPPPVPDEIKKMLAAKRAS